MITIALPSKGRMKDDATAIFERSGMKIVAVGNDRSYRGRIEGIDGVEIAYLSASEIARELASGAVDFGGGAVASMSFARRNIVKDSPEPSPQLR